jgi:hypothetical protein
MDSAENGAQLGLTWELTKRSRGTVKCGVMRKTFEDAQAPTLKTWTYSVDMSHELTGRTSVMISGARRVNESSLSGNSYLITTSGGADLSYQFVGKLFGVVRGSYSMDSFANAVPPDTVRRIDRISATGVGLRYAFKDWLGFTLDYTTSTRRSNLSQNDYVAHTTTVAVNMSF